MQEEDVGFANIERKSTRIVLRSDINGSCYSAAKYLRDANPAHACGNAGRISDVLNQIGAFARRTNENSDAVRNFLLNGRVTIAAAIFVEAHTKCESRIGREKLWQGALSLNTFRVLDTLICRSELFSASQWLGSNNVSAIHFEAKLQFTPSILYPGESTVTCVRLNSFLKSPSNVTRCSPS